MQAPWKNAEPRSKKSIELRRNGLRSLHRQQLNLLPKWRGLKAKGDNEAEKLLVPLLITVNAIASGLRTTG